MDKRQRKLIARFADKLEPDGTVSEALYGFNIRRGRETIDQFVAAVEANYLDWNWNDKKFQQLLSQTYRGKPPTSPGQLHAELQKSSQDDGLKNKLGEMLGVSRPQQPAMAPTPQPQQQQPMTAVAPQQPTPQPAVVGQKFNPNQLRHGQTYTVVYENFRGQRLTFKNATYYSNRHGVFAIFEFPRPAGRRNPGWVGSHPVIRDANDVAAKKQEITQLIADQQYYLQHIPNRAHRVNGRRMTLAQLKKTLPGWIKSIKTAEQSNQRAMQNLQRSIQSNTQRLNQIKIDPPVPMKKSLRFDRIISVI